LQNIENITLENWPVSSEGRLATAPAYHFAVKQAGVNLDFHVKQFFHGEEISFHFFQTFEELRQICLRYPVDVILIAGKSMFLRELEIVRAIKRHVVVSIVPVVLYHPDPDRDVVVASYENGAEDFIFGEWIARLVDVRIRRVIELDKQRIVWMRGELRERTQWFEDLAQSTLCPGRRSSERAVRPRRRAPSSEGS